MRTKKTRKSARAHEHDDYLTDPTTLARTPEVEGVPRSLGQRIAKIRRQRGLSMEDLANRTGLGVPLLQKIESDEYTPPLGELIRLGKALHMKMGYFISPTASKVYTIVRAHQRQPVARFPSGNRARQGYVYESLAPEKGDRKMEPFIVTMHPSDVGEMITHDGQEFIYVLEGRMEARVAEETEILEPGDAIYYDSTQPHLVKCHGDQDTRILAVLYTENK